MSRDPLESALEALDRAVQAEAAAWDDAARQAEAAVRAFRRVWWGLALIAVGIGLQFVALVAR